MKRLITFALIAAFAIGAATMNSCKKDGPEEPEDPQAAWYGTWKAGKGIAWNDLTITADKLILRHLNGDMGYTFENLTWTPVMSGDWSGYKFSGELTAAADRFLNDYPLRKAVGGGDATIGDIAADWWYIGEDRNELYHCIGSNNIEPNTSTPHVKQQ